MKLPREVVIAIINAFNCVSKAATKPHLHKVLLDPKDNRVLIAATDGHILSEVLIESSALTKWMKKKKKLVLPQAGKQLKTILKEAGGKAMEIDLPDDLLKLIEEENGEYPDYAHVKPQSSDADLVIGLNAELLLSLTKALRTKKNANIRMTIKNKNSPVEVTVDGNKGLIMPVRI